jgi:L-fuconolactonase
MDAIIDPDLPIIDGHHHLGLQYGGRYLIEEFQADLANGHNVRATVYVECGSMYRRDGPPELSSVGEAEFVAGVAAMSASGQFGPARICAGFVGAADLAMGERVEPVLDALAIASGRRLRGIRGSAIWDADPSVNAGTKPFAPAGLLLDPLFRAGFGRLATRGLVYDAWQYHPQLADVADLAGAFSETTIVVNHCGGLLGIGPYAGPDTFAHWRALVSGLALCPNVHMKLGGLGGRRSGLPIGQRTSHDLAASWRPYIETCIELFGVDRCMFESNYPPDARAGSYATIWNAFKLIATDYSPSEKTALFAGTAARVYGLSAE